MQEVRDYVVKSYKKVPLIFNVRSEIYALYIYIYIYIYIYTHTHTHIHTYIYIYVYVAGLCSE